jgi:hypothetical protein
MLQCYKALELLRSIIKHLGQLYRIPLVPSDLEHD